MAFSNDAVAVTGFVVLFGLMLLRVPVGMAMGLVGVSGFGYIVGGGPALKMVGQTSMRIVTDYTFGVIPMFLLMGAIASRTGMSKELFQAANRFVGHWRGGLGIATIAACAGFAAISGSSVATAATFSTVAYPEMRRFRLSEVVCHRGDRGRRHAGRDVSAVDRAGGVRADYSAGYRQAVCRGHPAWAAGGQHVHDHHCGHWRGAAGLAAGGTGGVLGRPLSGGERGVGTAAAVRVRHRRGCMAGCSPRPRRGAWVPGVRR